MPEFRLGMIGFLVAGVCFLGGIAGCDGNGAEPSAASTLQLVIGFDEERPMKGTGLATAVPNAIQIDSLRITRVRMLLRYGRIIGAEDTVEFTSAPTLVDLRPGDSTVVIETMDIGTVRYYHLDVRVHKPEPDADLLPEYQDPRFTEFLEGVRYSMIVDGRIYDVSGNTNFTYKSRATLISRLDFSPYLYIAPGASHTVTLTANVLSWFYDSVSGGYLNPIDQQNEAAINTAIVNSIRFR